MVEASWNRPRDYNPVVATVVMLVLAGALLFIVGGEIAVFLLVVSVPVAAVVWGIAWVVVRAVERRWGAAWAPRDALTQHLMGAARSWGWSVMTETTGEMPARWAWRMDADDRLHIAVDGKAGGYAVAVVLYWGYDDQGSEGAGRAKRAAYLVRLPQPHPPFTVHDHPPDLLSRWLRKALNQGQFEGIFTVTSEGTSPDLLTPAMCRLLVDEHRQRAFRSSYPSPRLTVIDDELQLICPRWPDIADLHQTLSRLLDAVSASPPQHRSTSA